MKHTRKYLTQQQYADGDCICFFCKRVNECKHRSRYLKECTMLENPDR